MENIRNIKKFILSQDSSILEVMEVINTNKPKIALLVEENGKLAGTITDGDIRRALSKKELNTNASEIMNKDFFASEVEKNYELIKKNNEKKRHQMRPYNRWK